MIFNDAASTARVTMHWREWGGNSEIWASQINADDDSSALVYEAVWGDGYRRFGTAECLHPTNQRVWEI